MCFVFIGQSVTCYIVVYIEMIYLRIMILQLIIDDVLFILLCEMCEFYVYIFFELVEVFDLSRLRYERCNV